MVFVCVYGKLLELVELKLKEVISKEPTLLVIVVGVPNVGKSALINSIHQIASARFPDKVWLYLSGELGMVFRCVTECILAVILGLIR